MRIHYLHSISSCPLGGRLMDGRSPSVLQRGEAGHWLLHAGDAYFHHSEMDVDSPWCTPGLRLYQTMMEKDRRPRSENRASSQ